MLSRNRCSYSLNLNLVIPDRKQIRHYQLDLVDEMLLQIVYRFIIMKILHFKETLTFCTIFCYIPVLAVYHVAIDCKRLEEMIKI